MRQYLAFAGRTGTLAVTFGLVECHEQGEDLNDARWRKSVLFDRFLSFGTDFVRTAGSLH